MKKQQIISRLAKAGWKETKVTQRKVSSDGTTWCRRALEQHLITGTTSAGGCLHWDRTCKGLTLKH